MENYNSNVGWFWIVFIVSVVLFVGYLVVVDFWSYKSELRRLRREIALEDEKRRQLKDKAMDLARQWKGTEDKS